MPLPEAVLAQVDTAAAPAKKAIGGGQPHKPAPVFDVHAEAIAAAKGGTTLNAQQTAAYNHVLDLYNKTSGDDMPGSKSPQVKAFIKGVKELNNLDADSQAKVIGRLMYHEAHRGPTGDGMIANLKAYTETGRELEFVTKTNGTPVPLDAMLNSGMIIGVKEGELKHGSKMDYEVPQWSNEDIKTLNQKVADRQARVVQETQHEHRQSHSKQI